MELFSENQTNFTVPDDASDNPLVFFDNNNLINETQVNFSIPFPRISLSTNSPLPPDNISYYLMAHVQPFDNNYSIHINWQIEDFLGIELLRADIPDLVYTIGPPSVSTTHGWLDTNNIILSNLNWDISYIFKLRTFNTKTCILYSDYKEIIVTEENIALRRKADKCTIIPLKTLENSLATNLSEVPKTYRYSRIVQGGSKQVICQNWRPQGCTAAATSAAIAAQSHKITVPSAAVATCAITAIEQPHPSTQEGWLERIQQAAGLVSSSQQYNTLNVSPFTGKLIINEENGDDGAKIANAACKSRISRRIGGKLPI